MDPRIDPSDELLRLARAQGDVISREQALMLGLTDRSLRRLNQTQWRRLCGGLFVVHRGPLGWTGKAWGGVLLGGEGSKLGGEAAAYSWGLCQLAPDPIMVWVRYRTPDRPGWHFVEDRLPRRGFGDPPRTGVADTVLDICADASADGIAAIVAAAVSSGQTTERRLAKALAGRRRIRQRRLIQEVLGEVGEGMHSPLERCYARDVERPHELPRALRQISVKRGNRVDVLYRDYGVIAELDGRRGHSGEDAFRDLRRDNAHATLGCTTLRYGWADVVNRPCEIAFQVAESLIQRGWPGQIQACSRCYRT